MGDRGQLALRFLAAASSGALLLLVSPPQNLWWLHYLSWVPVLWALRAGEHRRNILLGYCCGVVGEACVFSWIVDAVSLHSNIPFPVAVLVLGLYAAVFGLPFAVTFGSVHWLRERFGRAYVFLVPAVQVGMERIWPSLFSQVIRFAGDCR
jgi:apolipoprotein N-acyltransferase